MTSNFFVYLSFIHCLFPAPTHLFFSYFNLTFVIIIIIHAFIYLFFTFTWSLYMYFSHISFFTFSIFYFRLSFIHCSITFLYYSSFPSVSSWLQTLYSWFTFLLFFPFISTWLICIFSRSYINHNISFISLFPCVSSLSVCFSFFHLSSIHCTLHSLAHLFFLPCI